MDNPLNAMLFIIMTILYRFVNVALIVLFSLLVTLTQWAYLCYIRSVTYYVITTWPRVNR
jgi:hypothetical protein